MNNLKRKRQKNKFVIGALATLITASLVGVGFSAWNFAIVDDENNFTMGLTISATLNGTLIANSCTIDRGQDVGEEPPAVNIGFDDDTNEVGVIGGQEGENQSGKVGDTQSMDTEMGIITTFVYSSDVVIDGVEITMTFLSGETNADSNNIATSKGSSFTRPTLESGENYYYLGLPYNKITGISKTTSEEGSPVSSGSSYKYTYTEEDYDVTGYKQGKITLLNFEIVYANFFNNTSPQAFYNGTLATLKANVQNTDSSSSNYQTYVNDYLAAINQAKDELDAMKTALNNLTMNININIVTKTSTSSSSN